MKKVLFLMLAAIGLFGCHEDEVAPEVSHEGDILGLVVNIDKSRPLGRAMEEGHPNSSYIPTIFSISVYAYNSYGTATIIDLLTKEQIAKAIVGEFYFGSDRTPTQGTATTGAGAPVGLPGGTVSVDVVMNNALEKYTDISTNINYYNHRNEKDGGWETSADKADNSKNNFFGTNNFDRVFLTTNDYATKGQKLPSSVTKGANGVLQYTMSFTVAPALARFEAFGGIPTAEEELWVDRRGRYWKKVLKTEFLNNGGTENDLIIDGKLRNEMLKDDLYYYIPEAYWSGGDKLADYVYNHGGPDMKPAQNAPNHWVANRDFASWGTVDPGMNINYFVKWYPNAFYAVDVEEVYINNIKVTAPDGNVILTAWPGNSAESNGWAHWYKAYHLHGWHTAGYSALNAFYCMGNMWDRIATVDNARGVSKNVDFKAANLGITEVGGNNEMITDYIVGGAKPVAGVSKYYSGTRSIGIADNKAAAYMIYAQQSTGSSTGKNTDMPHLVLKVKCYSTKDDYDKGTPVAGKNFITIANFTSDGAFVTKFDRGTIYRVNLADLLGSFVGKFPVPGTLPPEDIPTVPGKPDVPVEPNDPVDPDPEMPAAELSVGITILEWTVKNIKPSI